MPSEPGTFWSQEGSHQHSHRAGHEPRKLTRALGGPVSAMFVSHSCPSFLHHFAGGDRSSPAPTGAQECQPGAGSGPWGHLLTSSAHECFHFCGPLQPQSELPPAGAPAAPQQVCCCLGPLPPAALSTCWFCLSPHPSGRKLRLCCHLWGPPSLLSDLA